MGCPSRAPTGQPGFAGLRHRPDLTQLAHTIAHRVGRFLERQGLLERDAENSYLASDAVDDDAMNSLLGHSIAYRIAIGPQAGRKAFTLQTLPAREPEDPCGDTVGKVAGFSRHDGVAARAPPLGVHQVHGGLFYDIGTTWEEDHEDKHYYRGYGLELNVDTVLFYYLPLQLAFGYAKGIDAGGEDQY